MALEPPFDFRMLVRSIVVCDEMEFLAGRRGVFKEPQELDPLLMPMPLLAETDHFAAGGIERGEQCGRSVTLVIVGHRSGPTRLQRQARLRAVQGLHLALLIDAQNNGLVRRIEIEPNDRFQLLAE